MCESTVRRYVSKVKKEMALGIDRVCVPQTHPLGEEAEVDFGEIHFFLNGVMVEAWMFVMRLSASAKAFHWVSFNQAQEVFIGGHVKAFEHFGGVPARVRYDNLKTAVTKVLKGRSRVETDRFVALRSYYLFDSFFCQPGVGGAHEKGGVEGEIGQFRRNFLVPVPDVAILAELNQVVARADEVDDRRHVDGRKLSVAEHFALERPHLRALPAERFAAEVDPVCRVDTKSRICVRQNFYSVPASYAGRRIRVLLGPNQVRAYDGTTLLATYERSPGRGREVLELDHYLEVLKIKAGVLASSSALAAARRCARFSPTHDRFWAEARRREEDAQGTRAIIAVLLLERTMDSGAVIEGMSRVLSVGSVDPELVAIEARRSLETTPLSVLGNPSLAAFDREEPTIAQYDQLLGVS